MTRAVLLAVVVCAAGCRDDRPAVLADVFVCNPNSRTADFDCGDGFLCYSGTQAIGSSICVPRCDPGDPTTCPGGACTQSGECLARCSVEQSGSCPAGGGVLSCVRVTYSPLEIAAGNDGICLPVGATCTSSADCDSPVFNLCTSETDGQQNNSQLATSGSICVQGGCQATGVSCEPGSSCLPDVLPVRSAQIPDVCTPNCTRRTRPGDMGTVDECLVGFTCVTTAFPQSLVRVCAPGMPGFICTDNLGCSVGVCNPWTDVGGVFSDFRTCSPRCSSDDDCVIYDNSANPVALTHFTCQSGMCRAMSSVVQTEFCAHDGDACPLDPAATCRVMPTVDMGAVDDCDPASQASQIAAAGCVRQCTLDSDCATLSANAHAPYTCAAGVCFPSLPSLTPCGGDSACAATLHCLPPSGVGPPYPTCTVSCTSAADCATNPALGSSYTCAGMQCVPKTPSGCAPPAQVSALCLSGSLVGGVCVSPAGWPCDTDARCSSGQCDKSTGVLGHCR